MRRSRRLLPAILLAFASTAAARALPHPAQNVQLLAVEEGRFENGRWLMERRWNGDQVDYGLNLAAPTLLKVRLGTYR